LSSVTIICSAIAETVLHGNLVLAESGRLELGGDILWTS